MNFHIVRTNESIEDIALIYNLDVIEITSLNNHIRKWENLTPGLKLRLPEISDNLSIELNDVEPFIEDYYPKLNPDLNYYLDDEFKEKSEEEIKKDNSPVEPKVKQNYPKYPYYPYYNPYYNYYRYYRKPRR